MTPEAFDLLFTHEGLRPFHPHTGSAGLMPMLVVYTETECVVFALSLDDFNDIAARHTYLRGLGLACAQRYRGVEAVCFGSEAWVRTFTQEEHAARGGRLVETYPDKEERIVVFGQMADGAVRIVHAQLYRRPDGTVERLGAWSVHQDSPEGKVSSPLLDAFWLGYRQGMGPAN